MGTAERIFAEVSQMPEPQAREVLDFVALLKGRQVAELQKRTMALDILRKYRGRFQAVKFSREELHER